MVAGFAGGKWVRRQPQASGGSGPEPELAPAVVGLAQTLGGIQIEGAGPSGNLCFRVLKAESAAAWP